MLIVTCKTFIPDDLPTVLNCEVGRESDVSHHCCADLGFRDLFFVQLFSLERIPKLFPICDAMGISQAKK